MCNVGMVIGSTVTNAGTKLERTAARPLTGKAAASGEPPLALTLDAAFARPLVDLARWVGGESARVLLERAIGHAGEPVVNSGVTVRMTMDVPSPTKAITASAAVVLVAGRREMSAVDLGLAGNVALGDLRDALNRLLLLNYAVTIERGGTTAYRALARHQP